MSRPPEQPVAGRLGPPPLPGGKPRRPRWLHRYARAEWRRLTLILGTRLTEADGSTLAALCDAVKEMRLAGEILDKEGRVFETATGYLSPHPAVAQQRSAWAAILKFSAAFGLDPASRAEMGQQPIVQQPLSVLARKRE